MVSRICIKELIGNRYEFGIILGVFVSSIRSLPSLSLLLDSLTIKKLLHSFVQSLEPPYAVLD